MKDTKRGGPDNSFLYGMVVGAIAGAVAAVFLAPDSGEKTRKNVKKRIQTLSEKVNLSDWQENISTVATKVSSDIEHEAKENIKIAAEKISSGADAVAGLADAVIEVAEESLADEPVPTKKAARKTPTRFKGIR